MRARLAAFALAIGFFVGAMSQTPLAARGTASQLEQFQAKEAHLFAIGWRLVTGNARFCENARPAIGVLLHDAAAYGDPQAVRDTLRLNGDIAVQTSAPGSPAYLSGLRANATLHSVNEVLIDDHFPPSDPEWQRLVDVNGALDAEFSISGPAIVAWSDPDGTTSVEAVTAVPVCPSRFELQPDGGRALAEGTRVIFGQDFAGFNYAEDEFAAAIAHELAHNLLGHRAYLDANGRGWSRVRETEREADRLAPWLLANAGYSPDAAIRFMRRWGPGNDGGLFRKRTHDGWDERLEAIEAELPFIRLAIEQTGVADWRDRFPRRKPE